MVQQLRFHAFIARGMGLIPDGGTKILMLQGVAKKITVKDGDRSEQWQLTLCVNLTGSQDVLMSG